MSNPNTNKLLSSLSPNSKRKTNCA